MLQFYFTIGIVASSMIAERCPPSLRWGYRVWLKYAFLLGVVAVFWPIFLLRAFGVWLCDKSDPCKP